jgi:hypothetical protein
MANPNPSPETRFGAENGNKPNGGKTSAQREAEYRAAENAAFIRDRMLSNIKEKLEAGEDPLQFIDAATLKLFKDSEDRAHGTPAQSIDHTSGGDKIAMPTEVVLRAARDNSDD